MIYLECLESRQQKSYLKSLQNVWMLAKQLADICEGRENVHSINVRICAEGIEEKEWLLKMKEMKVDYLQGYYFGRPCGKKQFLQQYASGINVK